MTEHYLSVSMENRFSFTCPVFNQEVEMRGCVLVREKVYKGQSFEQRRGCQACVVGGKCPAAEIVKRIAFQTNDATDRCSSTEVKVGKLPADALERIRPTIIPESVLLRFSLSGSERKLIETANDRIDQQIATAPREQVAGRLTRAPATATPAKRVSRSTAAQKAPANETVSAATSGDMSAAINAA